MAGISDEKAQELWNDCVVCGRKVIPPSTVHHECNLTQAKEKICEALGCTLPAVNGESLCDRHIIEGKARVDKAMRILHPERYLGLEQESRKGA